MRAREGFPADTYERVLAFPNFTNASSAVPGRCSDGGRSIRIETPRGPFHADYAICGTGHPPGRGLRPELASFADKIALWRHRYTAAAGRGGCAARGLSYLGPDYAFSNAHRVRRRGWPTSTCSHRFDPELRPSAAASMP